MVRQSALLLFLLVLWGYAYKDWFVSLCGLVLLTVLTQHNDFPQTMFGVTGMNPWNLSLAIITLFWFRDRFKRPGLWNAPVIVYLVIIGYAAIMIVAYARLVANADTIPPAREMTFKVITVDMLINPLKYMWAAVLFADGVTTTGRIRMALATILSVGLLYGLLVIKHTPLGVLVGGGDFMRYRHLIDKMIGLHANDMAKVMVVTFWGLFTSYAYWGKRLYRWMCLAGMPICLLATAMCFSRGGYVTFVVLGFMLAVLRYRPMLWLGPVGLILVAVAAPSVVERLTMDLGFGAHEDTDLNTVTAGRTGNLWPPVIDAIEDNPIVGYGRLGMWTAPTLYRTIRALEGGVPTSPHNGYLEVLLETGMIGMTVIGVMFMGAALVSWILLRRRDQPILVAVGGLGFASSMGCLVSAMSGAILFPDQGMLTILCAMALSVRVWAAQRHARRVAPQAVRPAPRMMIPRPAVRRLETP